MPNAFIIKAVHDNRDGVGHLTAFTINFRQTFVTVNFKGNPYHYFVEIRNQFVDFQLFQLTYCFPSN